MKTFCDYVYRIHVSGAPRGLGSHTASGLHGLGARVFGVGRFARSASLPEGVMYEQANRAAPDEFASLVAAVRAEFGQQQRVGKTTFRWSRTIWASVTPMALETEGGK